MNSHSDNKIKLTLQNSLKPDAEREVLNLTRDRTFSRDLSTLLPTHPLGQKAP